MNKMTIIVGCIIGCMLCGCTDDSIEAKYDAMTGKKLPEKTKIHKLAEGSDYEVTQTEIEGHLYFIAGSSKSYAGVSIIHAASCACKTNKLNDVER